MAQIKTLADLKALKNNIHDKMDTRIKGTENGLVQVKVAMATCGIAAGAKEIFDYMLEQTDKKGLKVVFTQTGCMGYCHAEPTIEVTVPGKDPIVFGYVDKKVVWTTDFIYFIPFVLLLLVMVKQSYQEIDRIHTKDAMWLVFHMVLYFAIWLWVFLSGPRGCVLAFNVLYATHILMNYMLSKNNYFKKQN